MKTYFDERIDALITKLTQFEYQISGFDPVWDVIFPNKKNHYHHIRITRYRETFYLHHIDGNLCSLQIEKNKGFQAMESFGHDLYDGRHDPAKAWKNLMISACDWLDFVKKDWIKAAKKVYESYPLNRRYGVVPHSVVRSSLTDIFRLDEALGKAKTKKFIRLVEEGSIHRTKHTTIESMTASDYFDYCRIAYLAGKRKDDHIDENMTGREMYTRYADGRDEGLLEISPDSPTEFADWIDGKHPKRERGGHPWEIKRGGNTTHIDLSVSRSSYDRSFIVSLSGASSTRLKETICMFLGIHQAGLPITISDPEGIRKRLLAQDNLGIVPCYDSLHRANQHFPEEDDVYDVLYFDDLGRYKRRIKPFITWEPLPILTPKSFV